MGMCHFANWHPRIADAVRGSRPVHHSQGGSPQNSLVLVQFVVFRPDLIMRSAAVCAAKVLVTWKKHLKKKAASSTKSAVGQTPEVRMMLPC